MSARSVLSLVVVLGGCGGGGSEPLDFEGRCSLVGEAYDAFSDADGARCGEGDGAGYCIAGDTCREAGSCEFVSSVTEDGYCALVHTPYDAFTDADGKRCGTGDGSGYCYAGDHCREPGICEAVLSANKGKPHVELFDKQYDAFTSADGKRCGTGDGSGYCFAGDRCVEPGICALTLHGLGGQVRADQIGLEYDAFSDATGKRCGTGEGSGYCKPGDRCVTPGKCEILLSAWTQ